MPEVKVLSANYASNIAKELRMTYGAFYDGLTEAEMLTIIIEAYEKGYTDAVRYVLRDVRFFLDEREKQMRMG